MQTSTQNDSRTLWAFNTSRNCYISNILIPRDIH